MGLGLVSNLTNIIDGLIITGVSALIVTGCGLWYRSSKQSRMPASPNVTTEINTEGVYLEKSRRADLSIEYEPVKPDFIRALEFIGTNIKQIRFRVRVHNNGLIDAKDCKATLILRPVGVTSSKLLQYDYLVWDGVKTEKLIRAGSSELLLVIFSDSCIAGRATACKHDALYSDADGRALQKYNEIIGKYSFDTGDYEAKLQIKALDNISTSARFRIHVDNDYIKTSMELLDNVATIEPTSNNPKNQITYYKSRDEVPPLRELLSPAAESIDMLGITFETITRLNFQPIRDALYRGVRVTFLILGPDSKHVPEHGHFQGGANMKDLIQRSLDILYKEQGKLPADKKDNLIIRTYDASISKSIIIIDRNDNDRAWIKVEDHVVGSDASSRPNRMTYKKGDESFYGQNLHYYDSLLEKSAPYFGSQLPTKLGEEQQKITRSDIERLSSHYDNLNEEVLKPLSKVYLNIHASSALFSGSSEFDRFILDYRYLSDIKKSRYFADAVQHLKKDLGTDIITELKEIESEIEDMNKQILEYKEEIHANIERRLSAISNVTNDPPSASNTVFLPKIKEILENHWFRMLNSMVSQRDKSIDDIISNTGSFTKTYPSTYNEDKCLLKLGGSDTAIIPVEGRQILEFLINDMIKDKEVLKKLISFTERMNGENGMRVKLKTFSERFDSVVDRIKDKKYQTVCDCCRETLKMNIPP